MINMNKILRDETRLDKKSHRRTLINLLLQKAKPAAVTDTKKPA